MDLNDRAGCAADASLSDLSTIRTSPSHTTCPSTGSGTRHV